MDQIKIGAFLKELRKEHELSQEQLAQRFNVSSRSVSRWENGNTMPDISIMIELADYYDIDIRDLLRGERKSEKMEENLKETLVMVADYTEADKEKLLNKVYGCGLAMWIIAIVLMLLYFLSAWFDYMGCNLVLTPVLLILAEGILAVHTLHSGLQLKGRMSKKRNKKLIRITVTIWVVLTFAILIFMVFFLPNILLYGQPTPPPMG
ncbi:Transcriptional regulator, contains XRE-family HTH domain [Ruminococcaceae bacterium KH2T8]|nr:Transcriptional regulator, contains XRE-family HTH domain [Ruminococcaceae bacterium KH2T8]